MRSVACLGPPQILFSKKSCAAQEAIHNHFRFFASLRGSFFAPPASVSLNGVSGETNFLANIASIQKSRWFFANLARESVVQAKLLANRLSQSARRNEEPRRSPNIWNDLLWPTDPFCQSRFVPQCFLFRDSLKLPLLVRPRSLSRLPSRFCHTL